MNTNCNYTILIHLIFFFTFQGAFDLPADEFEAKYKVDKYYWENQKKLHVHITDVVI